MEPSGISIHVSYFLAIITDFTDSSIAVYVNYVNLNWQSSMMVAVTFGLLQLWPGSFDRRQGRQTRGVGEGPGC